MFYASNDAKNLICIVIDDGIFVKMLHPRTTVRSAVTMLLVAVFALATTGLPVLVSYCCDVPVVVTAPAEDSCCDTDADCCETEVVVNKIDDQSIAQEQIGVVVRSADVIAILPANAAIITHRYTAHRFRSYLLEHPPHPPDQPTLAVFLI